MRDPSFAPAKVNLYLRITGRRADGYHLLDSLAVFAGIGDVVSAAPGEDLALRLAGPEALGLSRPEALGLSRPEALGLSRPEALGLSRPEALGLSRPEALGLSRPEALGLSRPEAPGLAADPDNLVLRAARALAAAAGVPARASLSLEKNLPVASGIGGGSADAAAALLVLEALWGTRLAPDAMARVAAGLGADVPVCLAGRPAQMRGVGEALSAVPALPRLGLLLANPRVALATPAVFRARQGAFSAEATMPAHFADPAALAEWLRPLGNDLQDAAIGLCPLVAEVLAAIEARPGCLLARMSGSGATCFGIFGSPEAASSAAAGLPAAWWRWGGGLASG